MAKILVASESDGVEFAERLLANHHVLVIVSEVAEALAKLNEQEFDLIMIGVHFDESRMFDLLAQCKSNRRNAAKPVICFCTRNTPLTRTMHNSIDVSVKAKGAWMYLDQHDYNVKKNPDAEVRRVIERCLVSTERQETQEKRKDIQKRREEILELRLALNSEEWTVDLEDRAAELRQQLSDVLLELSETLLNSVSQHERLAESTDLEDRVSPQVRAGENATAFEERQIMREESKQLAKEQKLAREEEQKAKERRHL